MSFELSSKNAVIGRTEEDILKYGEKGTAFLGKVVMSSGEHPVLGTKILMDIARPHLILVVGKRGSGKSYSMGVIIEEFAKQPIEIKNRLSIIVIDTVGIFWTMKIANTQEENELAEWNLSSEKIDVRVFVPQGQFDFYKKNNLPVDSGFTIKVSDLQALEWMALFELTWKDSEGILITRIVEKAQEVFGTYYGIDELIQLIEKDPDADKLTRDALKNRLNLAKSFGLFEKEGTRIKDIASPGKITIIDVSSYRQAIGMQGTRDIIVALLGKKLFEERMLQRKVEEIKSISGLKSESEMPLVWMLIDEAHMFMPKDYDSLALKVLLEWVRVGRQPGLSLLLATQRPGKLHDDVISQTDLFISNRLTAQEDIQAVSRLKPSYLHQDLDKYYAEMPRGKGYAIILDDNSERLWLMKMRPRLSWDGGKTAKVFTD